MLAVAGFSHDQYTAAQITAIEKAKADQALAASPITVAEVEAKIDANRKALEQKFQDDLAGRDRKVEESRKAALDAEAVQWTADADAYIAAHADDLVLTSVRGSGQALGQLVADDAYQRAEKNEAGQVVKWPAKLLTIEEAAKKFEESEAAKEAKIAERRKAKSAVVPETTQAQPPKIAAPGAPPVPPPAPRALTADMGGSQTGAKPVYRSASEKIAAAIAAGEAARDRK